MSDCAAPSLTGYGTSNIFTDESDIASDIEADLQDLPMENDGIVTDITSFSGSGISGFASPHFGGSLSSFLSDASCVPSIADEESPALPSPQQQQQNNYLRTASLKGVHTYLLNANLRERCGSPTCISFQDFIAVGTSAGFIFVFDRRQKLQFRIDTSTTEVGSDEGPITSLSQNLSSSRLLSGFASGRIAMWQLPQIDAAVTYDEIGEDDDKDDDQAHSEVGKVKVKNRKTASFLRLIDSAHQGGRSIIICAFTSLPTVAVSVDSSGSAYEMDFKRGILGRSTVSACFFSGNHGEICAISPLRPTYTSGLLQSYQRHLAFRALLGSAMIAMASFTKVIVVVLKPKFRVVFWQPLKGQPCCLPVLAWSWCFPRSEEPQSEESSAFLGFARASTFTVARIITHPPPTPHADVPPGACAFSFGGRKLLHRFHLLRTISRDQSIVALHFFTLDYLAILDTEGILRLHEIQTQQEVASSNLSTIQICCNSSAFKDEANRINANESLACVIERACVNSIASAGGKLLVLGKNGIAMLALKTWKERAIGLLKSGHTEEALSTCRQVLQNGSLTPDLREALLQVLMHLPLAHIKRLPAPLITSILVEICVTACLPEFLHTSVIPSYRQDALMFPLLLQCLCCQLLKLRPIYEVPDNDGDDCCLRHLAPDVVMEMLTWCVYGVSVALPNSPDTVSLTSQNASEQRTLDYGTHKMENGPSLAEHCLVRLSPANLNIDRIVKFCLSNSLYQGFVYVYTYVLRDHETAFRWLTDVLIKRTHSLTERQPFPNTGSSLSVRSTSRLDCWSCAVSTESLENASICEAVNAIILFLRSCFAGEMNFGIPLDSDLYADVPHKIFNLFLSSQVSSPEHRQKPLFPQPTTSKSYDVPRLRVLLYFGGTVDLLNMLSLALRESPFFSTQHYSVDLCNQRRRCLLNAFVLCVMDAAGQTLLPLDPNDVARVLSFVGGQVLNTQNDLACDGTKIFGMMKRLAQLAKDCEVAHSPLAELSDILHRLLSAGHLVASEDLLKVAENIRLSDFCEQIYRQQGNTIAVLSCLLTSLRRLHSVQPVRDTFKLQDLVSRIFDFINGCLTSSSKTGIDAPSLLNRFIESAELYARADSLRCLILLMQAFSPSMRRIIFALNTAFLSNEPLPRNLFAFSPGSSQPPQLPFDDQFPIPTEGPYHPAVFLILDSFYELLHSDLPELERENLVDSVAGDTSIHLALDQLLAKPDPLVAELYVRLLVASGRRESVCEFLKLNGEYRASVLLELLDEATYPRELAFIYEKIGDNAKATHLFQKDFLAHWSRLVDCCSAISTSANTEWTDKCDQVYSRANSWSAFAARQCSSKRSTANEPPWFIIIDTLSNLRKSNLCNQLTSELNNVFYKLLESASPYVPIPSLINRVLQLSDTAVTTFGSATNRFLVQLVSVWQKEVSLTQDCHRLIANDVNASEQLLVRVLKRGVGLRRYSCALCGLAFAQSYRQLRSLVTCNLHTGGFSTLGERQPSQPELLLFWCGHGVHIDCYENRADLYKSRLAGDNKVCLQCLHLPGLTSSPPLGNRNDDSAIRRPLLSSPSHLLDAHDEIQICPSEPAQKSMNPFGDDVD